MLLFYVPCPDKKTAEDIAQTLLIEKKIGCANVIESMTSLYWWHGEIERSDEVILVLKTLSVPGSQESFTKRIEELHPYDIPCVMTLPVLGINESYKRWLEESMK